MFSIPNPENKILNFDDFEMSPNLVLFDFDNIAPSSCFLPIRQSPRYKASSPIHCRLAQLSWVPFVDIVAKDFEQLVGQKSSGSKRKLMDASPKKTKFKKEVVRLQLKQISTKIVFNPKLATKKRSKT
jgi:hypothetical protein